MWYGLCIIIGVLVGVFGSWIFVKRHYTNGEFQINETDANKDVYKMVVIDFDKLHKRKWLLLRITRK